MKSKQVLKWAEFVATKFESSQEGWSYTRNLGGLKYIRYADDTTGYDRWDRRLLRAFKMPTFNGLFKPEGFRDAIMQRIAWFRVSLRVQNHLPDGIVSGNIITFWEEDGEYITLFGPTVGIRVLEFLKSEPNHPHAIAILEEMTRIANENFDRE